ncbi:MAG: hypothetical protein ACRD4Q_14740, partial [Candidatus Acidiferrales bacterium]
FSQQPKAVLSEGQGRISQLIDSKRWQILRSAQNDMWQKSPHAAKNPLSEQVLYLKGVFRQPAEASDGLTRRMERRDDDDRSVESHSHSG